MSEVGTSSSNVEMPASSRPQRGAYALSGSVEGERRRFFLREGRNRVGSLPSNEVHLPVDGVSKLHAVLELRGGRLQVEDLASKNGTFVNRRSANGHSLQPGDELRFGPATLTLEQLPRKQRLALDLPLPSTAAGQAPGRELPDTSTALPDRGSDTAVSELPATAITAVESLLDLAAGPGGATTQQILHCLGNATGADSAFLLRLEDDEAPAVLAALGSGPPPMLGRPSDGSVESTLEPKIERLAAPDGEPSWLVASLRLGLQSRLALALSGLLPDRRSPQQGAMPDPAIELLLRVCLRLFAHQRPGYPTTAPTASEALAMPVGQVRLPSSAMARVYDQLARVANTELPILLTGETGVGKEGLAQLVHLASPRHQGPFVAVNCAAIPEDLLEAELFGIESGVATGVRGRCGKLSQARGGTLFLDEIGDMPMALQAKLLRVLQEGEIVPLGGEARPLDARIVAATNAEPEQCLQQGTLRQDLYYRLAGLALHVPPLRQRPEDIPALITYFLERYSRELGKAPRGVTVQALEQLQSFAWPGNVRQLEHAVRRLVALCASHQAIDDVLLQQHGGLEERSGDPVTAALREIDETDLRLEQLEQLAVSEALRRTEGNRSRAARLLGISREALRRRLLRRKG